jgi:hypothetical protein
MASYKGRAWRQKCKISVGRLFPLTEILARLVIRSNAISQSCGRIWPFQRGNIIYRLHKVRNYFFESIYMLVYIDLIFATIPRVITAILFANTTFMIEYKPINLHMALYDHMKQFLVATEGWNHRGLQSASDRWWFCTWFVGGKIPWRKFWPLRL